MDLLSDDRTGPEPRVHEDANGEIFVQGVASRTVNSPHEVHFDVFTYFFSPSSL